MAATAAAAGAAVATVEEVGGSLLSALWKQPS